MKTVVTYICKDKSIIKNEYDYDYPNYKLNYNAGVDAYQAFEDKNGVMQIIITKR